MHCFNYIIIVVCRVNISIRTISAKKSCSNLSPCLPEQHCSWAADVLPWQRAQHPANRHRTVFYRRWWPVENPEVRCELWWNRWFKVCSAHHVKLESAVKWTVTLNYSAGLAALFPSFCFLPPLLYFFSLWHHLLYRFPFLLAHSFFLPPLSWQATPRAILISTLLLLFFPFPLT